MIDVVIIVDQSFELRAYLVGQIARTLTVFGVQEIVIFEDSCENELIGFHCSMILLFYYFIIYMFCS